MATLRPKDAPAASVVQIGDTFLIDGTTGVRALAATSVPVKDANANLSVNSAIEGYTTTATAAGTTVLTVASTRQQYFTGVTTQTVTLPVTSTLALGQGFVFQNNSTGAVTVQSSGGNAVVVVAPGASATVTCILLTGTTAASWSVPTALALNGASVGMQRVVMRGINFNSANTDNSITIPLPAGYTRYTIYDIIIGNASASLSGGTVGVFSAAAAGGNALVTSATALTITTASANTAANIQHLAPTAIGAIASNYAAIFFRTQSAVAATADVTVLYLPNS